MVSCRSIFSGDNTMADESVFRFLSVRPADLKNKQVAADKKVPVYPADENKSELYRTLAAAVTDGATKEVIVAIANRFQQSEAYVGDVRRLEFDVTPLRHWLAANSDTPLAAIDLREELKALLGRDLADVVKSAAFRRSLTALADTLLADAVARTGDERRADEIAAAFKLLALLRLAAGEGSLPGEGRLGELISHTILVLPDLSNVSRLPTGESPPEPEPPTPDDREEEVRRLRARLADLETAHRELSRLASNDRAIYRPRQDVVGTAQAARIDAVERRLVDLAKLVAAGDPAQGDQAPLSDAAAGAGAQLANREFVLSLRAVEGLSDGSRSVLQDLQFEAKRVSPVRAVGLIEEEMRYISSQLASDQAPKKVLMIGGAYLDMEKFRESLGISPYFDSKPFVPLAMCDFQVGIGDLLMVRQTLKAYELAEFAHVENVLAGESREREHRRLNVREEITVVEEERETEKERDLQSTERNELQSEAEKTVQSQFELEAGLQVSGSYGPAVSFSASLNVGFSTSTEETQRKAMSYSREVTEKTAERIRERVREERRRRVLEEIEEINRHKVDNSDASNGHVRGIYRWLNKIYDAQVFNYGQRMMYEFTIPEPAAYFLYALVENPPQDMELVKPEPPHYGSSPLKPSNLTRTNYHDYVSQYQVLNAPEPPSEFTVVSYFDKQDGNSANNVGRSSKVTIVPGYEAIGATVSSDYIFTDGKPHSFRIMLGNASVDRSNIWGAGYETFPHTFRGEMAVASILMNVWAFTLSADVFCELTSEGMAKWQHDMYEAIMQAYLQQKAEYDEKLAAAAIQKGIEILGRNPLENRRLERDELKKLVIMMLTGSPYIALNSFYAGSEPLMNIGKACANGKRIRFFENAFEWRNMLYVFYPYFWGRKARWISALHLTDPDLDFAAFLKAGAARVQVPVRPGFERAVAHFCQYGDIWEGNDIPLMDDELYVPIVDEITENLGKLDDGVPYPEDSEPWEVTVPTSLVVVQDLEEIPGIRDILTGNEIDIQNENA
jgi:hypothetical protein